MATTYIKQSISYDSSEMDKICSAAKKNKIAVVLGFSENDGDSLYISQCIISAAGEIVNKRRKLKPTHMERTVFGDGDASTLFNVADLENVGRVGALSCFEHLQPLLKYHNISQKEQIHVAAWPPLHPFDPQGEALYPFTADGKLTIPRTLDYTKSTQAVEHFPRLMLWNLGPLFFTAPR
jgi:predicted amidohydrolase